MIRGLWLKAQAAHDATARGSSHTWGEEAEKGSVACAATSGSGRAVGRAGAGRHACRVGSYNRQQTGGAVQ